MSCDAEAGQRPAAPRRAQSAAAILAAAGIFPGPDELRTLEALFMFARRKTEAIYSLPLDYDA